MSVSGSVLLSGLALKKTGFQAGRSVANQAQINTFSKYNCQVIEVFSGQLLQLATSIATNLATSRILRMSVALYRV